MDVEQAVRDSMGARPRGEVDHADASAVSAPATTISTKVL